MSRTTQSRSTTTLASAALYILFLLSIVVFMGCSSDNSVGSNAQDPTQDPTASPDTNSQTVDEQPAPNCLHDHSAILNLANDSRRTVYRITVDNHLVATLRPGYTTRITITAAVHVVQFTYATGVPAYSETIDPFSCEEVSLRWSGEEPIKQNVGQSTSYRRD